MSDSNVVLRHGKGRGCEGDECAGQRARRIKFHLEVSPEYACPEGASPLIWDLMVRANDMSHTWRAELADDDLLRAIGTSLGDAELEWRRVWRCVDWRLREELPAGFEGLATRFDQKDRPADAEALRSAAASLHGMGKIVGQATLRACLPVLESALALARARVLALALARARVLALARARARALDLALARARARALDLALARARARVLDLAHALDHAHTFALADLPSPVKLIRELVAMSPEAR